VKNVRHQTTVKPAPPSQPVLWVYVLNGEPTRITNRRVKTVHAVQPNVRYCNASPKKGLAIHGVK